MRFQIICITLAAGLLVAPAVAQTSTDTSPAPAAGAVATTPAPTTGHYTTAASPIGDMLDDPAAKAVLVAHIPAVVNNPQIDQARSMTLKSIQAYAPDLTDATLAAIDSDLAKLPAK